MTCCSALCSLDAATAFIVTTSSTIKVIQSHFDTEMTLPIWKAADSGSEQSRFNPWLNIGFPLVIKCFSLLVLSKYYSKNAFFIISYKSINTTPAHILKHSCVNFRIISLKALVRPAPPPDTAVYLRNTHAKPRAHLSRGTTPLSESLQTTREFIIHTVI